MLLRKHGVFLRGIALVLGLVVFCAASKAEDVPQGIVLIGWDGAQRDHVKEMMARNELPYLAALAKDGTMVDIDIVTGATDTKAGWAQILTGYAPEKSRVYSNSRFEPIPEGYTIFERLEKFLGPGHIETVALISKKGNLGIAGPKNIPLQEWRGKKKKKKKKKSKPGLGDLGNGKVVKENGSEYVLEPGEPYSLTKNKVDLFINDLGKNAKVGVLAMEDLEKFHNRRFFLFVHFCEPDQSGHKYGENSQEYSDGLKLDDLWTGKIVDKLKELKMYDKTLVYVTVDHGFEEGKKGHAYAPYVFVATNDKKVVRSGTREDIAPTILKRFGMDLPKIDPPLDGIDRKSTRLNSSHSQISYA